MALALSGSVYASEVSGTLSSGGVSSGGTSNSGSLSGTVASNGSLSGTVSGGSSGGGSSSGGGGGSVTQFSTNSSSNSGGGATPNSLASTQGIGLSGDSFPEAEENVILLPDTGSSDLAAAAAASTGLGMGWWIAIGLIALLLLIGGSVYAYERSKGMY